MNDAQGNPEPGWPQQSTEREPRGLAVYDLDVDGTMEVIVNSAPIHDGVGDTLAPGGVVASGYTVHPLLILR